MDELLIVAGVMLKCLDEQNADNDGEFTRALVDKES